MKTSSFSSSTPSPIVFDASLKIITDYRATGSIEFKENSAQLYFTTTFDNLNQEIYIFDNAASFINYLSSCDKVDTWEIKDKASGKLSYKHRYIDGEIEHFNSEYALNLALSQEYDGKWKIQYLDSQTHSKPSRFMLAEPGYWSTQFKQFDNKAMLLTAYQQQVSQASFLHRLYSYSISALTLAATGTLGYQASRYFNADSQYNTNTTFLNDLAVSSTESFTTAASIAAITYGFNMATSHPECAAPQALLAGLSSFLPYVEAEPFPLTGTNDKSNSMPTVSALALPTKSIIILNKFHKSLPAFPYTDYAGWRVCPSINIAA